jgi:prophage regulatory protein
MSLQIKETPKQLVKRKKVEELTSLSKSSIYRLMSDGIFPKPIRLGSKSVAWIEADIMNWINARIAESREA